MKKEVDLYAEVLGAYLEDRLPKSEMSLVNKVIASDIDMETILAEMEQTAALCDLSSDLHEDFPHFSDKFVLPTVPEPPSDSSPSIPGAF